MRLELTGRHLRITPSLRRLVEDGLDKLDRLLHDGAVSLQVVLSEVKYRRHVEATLHARGERYLHSAGSGRDWETALNQALGRINQQVRKLKGKWTDGKRSRLSTGRIAVSAAAERALATATERDVRIIRARRYEVKPMSIDEAAVEVGQAQDAFIVFRNADTDAVTVMFRRADGNLGLIEPEA